MCFFDLRTICLSFEITYQHFKIRRFHIKVSASNFFLKKDRALVTLGTPPHRPPSAEALKQPPVYSLVNTVPQATSSLSWLPAQPLGAPECVVHAQWPRDVPTHGPGACCPEIPELDQDLLTSAWAGPAWHLAHRGPPQIPISFLPLPHMPGCPEGRRQV